MKTKDARLIISAIARATKLYFARRKDLDALAARVEQLEQQLGDLKKQREEAS